MYIGVQESTDFATVKGLEQGYVICESHTRFLLLFTFLKKNMKKKKIIVFFSSCNAVKYYGELLNYIDVPCLDLHGKQKQHKRTTTFFEFCNAKNAILLCTDVAARGLDIPKVDWIIQFDPTDDPREYIHRVGRTARGESGAGKALLFLLPTELGFLRYLKDARVPLNEYDFPKNKISNVQSQLEKLISKNYYLNRSAKDGYRGYIHSYASHSLKVTHAACCPARTDGPLHRTAPTRHCCTGVCCAVLTGCWLGGAAHLRRARAGPGASGQVVWVLCPAQGPPGDGDHQGPPRPEQPRRKGRRRRGPATGLGARV